MPARVFLVEGANDGGALGRSIRVRENDDTSEGALQPLVRRLSTADLLEIRGQKVTMLSLGGITEPELAIGRRARLASVLARFDGCDALVFHQDVDGPANGVADDRVAAWEAVVDAIRRGAQAADREGDGLAAAACVAAAPLRTIESWLLGDAASVRHAAAADSEDISALIKDPESLWGKRRVLKSAHPKNVLRRGVGGARARARTADYRTLAEHASLAEIGRRCPVSFPPFADAIGALGRDSWRCSACISAAPFLVAFAVGIDIIARKGLHAGRKTAPSRSAPSWCSAGSSACCQATSSSRCTWRRSE